MTLRVMILATLVALASGCVSTSKFEALENRVAAVEKQASDAATASRQAQSDAATAARNVGTAQQTADRAMKAAEDAAERANRIANTCCARK